MCLRHQNAKLRNYESDWKNQAVIVILDNIKIKSELILKPRNSQNSQAGRYVTYWKMTKQIHKSAIIRERHGHVIIINRRYWIYEKYFIRIDRDSESLPWETRHEGQFQDGGIFFFNSNCFTSQVLVDSQDRQYSEQRVCTLMITREKEQIETARKKSSMIFLFVTGVLWQLPVDGSLTSRSRFEMMFLKFRDFRDVRTWNETNVDSWILQRAG